MVKGSEINNDSNKNLRESRYSSSWCVEHLSSSRSSKPLIGCLQNRYYNLIAVVWATIVHVSMLVTELSVSLPALIGSVGRFTILLRMELTKPHTVIFSNTLGDTVSAAHALGSLFWHHWCRSSFFFLLLPRTMRVCESGFPSHSFWNSCTEPSLSQLPRWLNSV